jgi:serine protease Do
MKSEDIVQKLRLSVHTVQCSDGAGTGMSIDDKGHVLTCNHVLSGDDAVVILHTGHEYPAFVEARDRKTDLAVLKVEGLNCPPVTFADPASVSEGQTVIALGNPLGFNFSVSRGIVSSRNRVINSVTFIQTDVAINPGNSGGPIVNDDGEVIGIADWFIEKGQGLGFAVALRHIFSLAAIFRFSLRRGELAPSHSIDHPSDAAEKAESE